MNIYGLSFTNIMSDVICVLHCFD